MTTPVLRMQQISKRYGQVEALRGADLDVHPGEVVGLVGDNGAGKSTLVKVLSGTEQPDGGQILLDGQSVRFDTPAAARAQGLETVYQDLALAPDLDAPANLFLGREIMRGGAAGWLGLLDKKRMRQRADQIFSELRVQIPALTAPVAAYSGGQRQAVAVARAASWATRALLLDEPTAALGVVQTRQVLDLIREIRDSGVAVVLVSHSMPDVFAVCDRVQVLRAGRRVATFDARATTVTAVISAMTGADLPAPVTGTSEVVS